MIRYEGLVPVFLGAARKFRDELLRRLGLLNKFLELEVLRILSAIKSGQAFVDVGAFKGTYSLFCAQRCCTVFAFEPNPAIFKRLNERLSKYQNVKCYNLALGERDNMKNFYVPEGAPDQSSLLQRRGKIIMVNVKRLDEFIHISPDIIKIDVEGYAFEVLLGAIKMLNTYAPRIILEFHSMKEYKKCKGLLRANGYLVKLLDFWKDHGHLYAVRAVGQGSSNGEAHWNHVARKCLKAYNLRRNTT